MRLDFTFGVMVFLHIAFGNMLIGLIKGINAGLVFKTSITRAFGYLTISSYLSSICVAALASLVRSNLGASITIFNGVLVVWLMVLGSFIIMVLVDWPVCYRLMREQAGAARRSLKASITVQLVPYLLIFGWYAMASRMTVATAFHPTKDLSFAAGSQAVVYYISDADGAIYRVKPDGTDRTRVCDSGRVRKGETLLLWESQSKGYWNLSARDETDMFPRRVVLKRIAYFGPQSKDYEWRIRHNYNDVCSLSSDLRPKISRNLTVRGCDMSDLLRIDSRDGQVDEYVWFRTPFMVWTLGNINVLPGDLVVCEFNGQVLVMDLNEHKVGLLVRGRGPVAVVTDRD